MPSALTDKTNQTKNSFPPQNPGAVAACPFAAPISEDEAAPVGVQSAYGLTMDIMNSPVMTNRAQEKQKEKAWVEIVLIDLEGMPVPGVRYRVTTPEGEVREGSLNEHGQAGFYQIDPGNCKITFPDLDKDAWD